MVSLRAARIGLAFGAALTCVNAAASEDDRLAVEQVVAGSETAIAALDGKRADSYLASNARWIEGGRPEPAENAAWCARAKDAGVHITYVLRDFNVQVHGDVAWVTLAIEGSFLAPTAEALELMGHKPDDPRQWRSTTVESVVLRKISGQWKIVLGHSSVVPTK